MKIYLFDFARHFKLSGLVYFFIFCLNLTSSGQAKRQLKEFTKITDSIYHKRPSEKLYLQLDKPYYSIGDTIWYKAYLFNAAYFTPTATSGILYVDIANDSNKVMKQYRLPLQTGLTWGNIGLDEKDFTPGTYTVRAYTNWMRNFGDNDFFYRTFYIIGANENSLLVNVQSKISTRNDKSNANTQLQFTDINKVPIADKPLQLHVTAGSKTLYGQKTQTSSTGLVSVNFSLPGRYATVSVVAESEKKDIKVEIPLQWNRPENTDLQFLPEGGDLVAGLPAHIGFKAVGENGRGTDISGIIIDSQQKQAAIFRSTHNGMGSFELSVKSGESYTAKVSLPNGIIKTYPLPVVKNSGTVLQVTPMESDSLEVMVVATNDLAQTGSSYFLIGRARGIVCYAAVISFRGSHEIKRRIAKQLFPTGITHFTLLTTGYQSLNERMVFVDHHDNLNIQLTTEKPGYATRDSIAVHLKVTDNNGQPVRGNFSLAVNDDTQVKTDTLNNRNILTDLLLTSSLKGYIEEPGYYLSANTNSSRQALDNLLLTQGWAGYDWQQALSPPALRYQPELEFMATGKVTNVFNKPLPNVKVSMLSRKPIFLADTVTNKDGHFTFNNLPYADTAIYFIQARNRNGKSFNVNIDMDEVKAPVFIKPIAPVSMPWYVNSDTTMLNYTKSDVLLNRQKYLPTGGHLLKEVKITAKKLIKGSENLNGPGNADQVIDEKELEKAGKKTFLQLLQEKVKGFKVSYLHQAIYPWYFINEKPVKLIVDGVNVSSMFSHFDFIDFKQYLESRNAEDIKGIEVISSPKYNAKYKIRYLSIVTQINLDPTKYDIAFIEITTRSGHGPLIDNTPGVYLYKPLPFSLPKQFYKPKYTVNDTTQHMLDLRSTIHWEPNIVTNKNGMATVSFYAADKLSTYTLTIEGSDMNGSLGYRSRKIKIDKKKSK